MSRGLSPPVPHDGTGALDDLSRLALLVDLAKTRPLPKLHVRIDLKVTS